MGLFYTGGKDYNTYNTYTGLGDTQFADLQTGQTGLGTAIGTVASGVSGLSSAIGGTATQESMDSGFTNLNTNLGTYGDTITAAQTSANADRQKYYDDLVTAMKNNVGGLATQSSLDTGFADATGRFNTLDSSVGGVQGSVDQVSTDLGEAQSSIDAGFADATGRFDTLDTSMTDAQSDRASNLDTMSDQLTTTQANVLGGQGDLQGSLDTMSSTADNYATTMLGNQDTMMGNQGQYMSDFDTYVDRYGQDTALAQQSRSDLAEAQANQTEAMRDDLGIFAQAATQGQTNIQNKIGNLGEGTQTGFEQLSSALGTGFTDATLSEQQAQQNLAVRIGNVKDMVQNVGDTLGADTKSQYTQLTNAFDENGSLISNAIDEQGNTITRSMDDQGIIIERKLDTQGNEISAVQMDVGTMLGNAEMYERSLMGQIDQGFDEAIQAEGATTAAIAQGFNIQDKKLATQTRDMSRMASEQSDLDVNMRNEFRQLGQAFDDSGALIGNSVLANGSSISRALDSNGNLLLRSFDPQGSIIGNQVINVNNALNNLSKLNTIQGANTSMGNLSPAMSAGSGSNTGFASNYAITG